MSKHIKVVGLGDSTTAGTPAFRSPLESPPNGAGNVESQYAYWMMKIHPEWDVLNKGINGQRSDEIFLRFDRDVRAEDPDYVIVLAGVNDVYQGFPEDSVRRNLERMYSLALAARIIPLAATILPYNSMGRREANAIRGLNGWISSRSIEMGILFCDTNDAVSSAEEPETLKGSPDGLHPDVAGYRRMGESLAKSIEGHLSRPRS